MEIVQPPITDVIPRTVLTTQGDIIVRGVGDPERLAIGTISQRLRVNNAGTGLEYVDDTLNSITGGVLANGSVPIARATRINAASKNGGAVTVLNTYTVITTLDLGNVSVNDIILFNAFADLTKGATLGDSALRIEKSSGTAALSFTMDDTMLHNDVLNIAATKLSRININGYGVITGAGSLIVKLSGVSIGSNSTVAIGKGQLQTLVLLNS